MESEKFPFLPRALSFIPFISHLHIVTFTSFSASLWLIVADNTLSHAFSTLVSSDLISLSRFGGREIPFHVDPFPSAGGGDRTPSN